jgi:hypothetical protein
LIGHVFNGYDTTHQKPALKKVMEKYRSDKVEAERVTLEGPVLESDDLQALSEAGRVVPI